MGYIKTMIAEVNKTHPNLGELTAISQIVIKARKFMLIVSPSGCGKSRVMEYLGKNTQDSWSPMSLSISSLGNKVERLTGFRSAIFVDDIATIQTTYSRTTTITTLSGLCYTHRVEPSMTGFDFCIEDFYGSAIIGIQPVILKDLMLAPEWDASIQDKALRYYHLYRPTHPKISLPEFEIKHGIQFEKVLDFEPDTSNEKWQKLVDLGLSQWSIARTKEHMIDFLKGIAALENRREVILSDYDLLFHLLKPMALENIAVVKEQLEGERYLDNNLLALLTEYYTYKGQFSLAQVAIDFKMPHRSEMSLSQVYRIIASQNGNWKQIQKSPTIFIASKALENMLKSYDLEVKIDNKNT